MRANYKNTIKKLSGNTSDIVSVVIETYNKDFRQVVEVAQSFRYGSNSTRDICQNIFNHIIENVQYKEDPIGVQWVKTPARLMADKVGDCKSMSIFTASCLRVLGIDHFFRFVSFNRRKEATHVYVVAVDESGKQIIIDPVVRRNGLPVFNFEEKYTFKSDMRGTDIYYLSGIYKGNNEVPVVGEIPENRFDIWIGDRNNLSPGKLSLYARLDYLIELAGITTERKELSAILNQLDILTLAIRAYDHTDGNPAQLEKLYFIIASMVRRGIFNSNETDYETRKSNIQLLENQMYYQAERGYNQTDLYDIDTLSWLTSEVLSRLSAPGVSGFFDLFSARKMEAKLKEAAMYYIYIFIPDAQARKESYQLQRKRNTQLRTLNWQEKVDIWHNRQACINIIRSGIIAKTGKTPEQWLADAKKNNYRIGIAVTTVVGIISAILGLIKLIISIFGKKQAPPSDNEVKYALANTGADGWTPPPPSPIAPSTNTSGGLTTAGMGNKFPMLVVGGLALGMLFKKK